MKRFFVSFLLSFIILCMPFAVVKINSYAEGTIEAVSLWQAYNVRDSFKYNGALPTASDTFTINFSLRDKTPPQSEYAYSKLFSNVTASDSIVLHICDMSGNIYGAETEGGYTVLNEMPGVAKSFKYNSSNIVMEIAANYTGSFSVYYYGTVSSGGSTYDTDISAITFNIYNYGIYFKNGYNARGIVIPVEEASSYTFNEDFFRNYILCGYDNGTVIPASEVEIGTLYTNEAVFEGIDISDINNVQSIGCAFYDNGNLKFSDSINLVIYQETAAQDTISMMYDGSPIPETTATNRYTITISAGESITGTIDCLNGWSAISLTSDSYDFAVSYRIEGEDDEEYISYEIFQRYIFVGYFDLDVVITDDIEGYEETVYLTINVTTVIPPMIQLYSEEINVPKNSLFSDVLSMFRGNIENIVLYNGTHLLDDIIENPLKVIIECDIVSSDMSRAGSYNINYSYTDDATSLTGTAVAVLNVIDASPELYDVVARVAETNALIVDNRPDQGIAMGTAIYFNLAAMDDDEDDITYHGSVNSSFGTLTQDGVDDALWRFVPNARMSGEVVFTFYASDGNSTSEYEYYTIYYLDTIPPTITFTSEIREVEGEYYLDINRKVIVDFNNYIVSVSDNSDPQPSNNDVVITANGFTFLEGYRFKFENVTGNFSVTYSLTDSAGNEQEVVVNIVISNEAPTAENVSCEARYQDVVSIDIANRAKDDTKIFGFEIVGMITGSTGQALETDTFDLSKFSSEGKLQVKLSPVYNGDQGRRIPFVGNAYIRYKVVDGDGASSPEYTITLNITDDTKPVVSVVEGTKTSFIRNKEYPTFTKEGYFTAMDEIDGILTPTSIKILQYGIEVAAVDFTRRGEYELEYEFVDASGNSEIKKVTLSITDGEKPVIELLAEGTTIVQGGSFNMYDFIVSIKDEEDGTKTSGWKAHEESGFLIIVDDNVDTLKAGRYEIRMFCVDNDGNTSEEVIFVLLVEEPPQGFPIWILYIAGGAVGLILMIIIIRVAVVKRRMRI